jgi:hypothetical protein
MINAAKGGQVTFRPGHVFLTDWHSLNWSFSRITSFF